MAEELLVEFLERITESKLESDRICSRRYYGVSRLVFLTV